MAGAQPPVITAPTQVPVATVAPAPTYTATVASQPGETYVWSLTGGGAIVTATSGTQVSFTARGTPGTMTLTCKATNRIGDDTRSGAVMITAVP